VTVTTTATKDLVDCVLEPLTLEEMGRALCAALDDDAGVSAQAIGLLAKYLQYRVDGAWRVTLEDVSGLAEDQDAIAELLDAGMLTVALPVVDNDFEQVYLAADPQAAHAAPVEEAIAYLYDVADVTAPVTGDEEAHDGR
jgi:hypothetical protein